jgi:hypothetical protein
MVADNDLAKHSQVRGVDAKLFINCLVAKSNRSKYTYARQTNPK